MLKPLSAKTLARKYSELGLSPEIIDLLHTYFLCFSNLYGLITIQEAWDIFRNYEGIRNIHKKDFIAVSSIVQREEQPYVILEMKEVFSGETSEKETDRLIINRKLLYDGYRRFEAVYFIDEQAVGKPRYIPESRDEFLSYSEDPFWKNPAGAELRTLLAGLKTSGVGRSPDFAGKADIPITDLDGKPVKGKRLSAFCMNTQMESINIDMEKRESRKKLLTERFRTTPAEKLYQFIESAVQGKNPYLIGKELSKLFERLDDDFGAVYTQAEAEKIVALYSTLNNTTNMWSNAGWTPDELMKKQNSDKFPAIQFGPGMQKMFEDGEMDREELTALLKKNGFDVL